MHEPSTTSDEPVEVSRRIDAPAATIFAILADPRRHLELDGSGMLRGAVTGTRITGVGDVFVMAMHADHLGDYQMNNHVVEFEQDRRIGWEPRAGSGHPGDGTEDEWGHRWVYDLVADGPDATVVTESYDCSTAPPDERASMEDGRIWLGAMSETLERLDAAATGS